MKIFHQILNTIGYTAYRKFFIPKGIDWIWDVRRASPYGTIQYAVDVGANIGDISLKIAKNFPECVTFSFEPSPTTFRLLIERVRKENRIQCEQLALSNRSGSMSFIHSESYPTHSRLIDSDVPGSITVPVTTLEQYLSDRDCSVDLLKTDTEGWDFEVLEGCGATLEQLKWVVSEVTFDVEAPGSWASGFRNINGLLESRGFSLYSLCDYNHRADCSILYCNALWANIRKFRS